MLHGRQAEIDQLGHAVRVTADGSGAAVLLEGPAGIGKTTLLRATRELAVSSGFVVCAGECDELDQITPLAPLLAGLRSSVLPLVDAAEQRAMRTSTEPMWAVERLGSILDKVSARQPVLVTVDDIQWADQSTLLALSVLPARLFAVPVLWVLARRTNPVSPQVQTLIERLGRATGAVRSIGPLSAADSLAIASEMLGARPDRRLSGLIDQVAGNPFYLVELIDALRADHAVRVAGGLARLAVREVPERFRSAVAAHIRPLSDPARRLVDVASVLGRRFPLGDLAALLGRPVGRLLGEIEEARRAGILIDVGEDLTFRHDLLREAVYAGLPSSVRQALHRDAAAAMLARGADTVSVAAHVAVGAVPGDEQAVRMLERAAAELKGSNPSAAADLACQALDLRAPDDPERPARAAQVVDLLAWAGRPDQAVPLAEQTLASGPLDPTVEATLLVGIRLSILNQGETIRHLAPLPPRLLADPTLSPTLARTLRHFDAFGRRYADFDGADQVCKAVAEEAAAAGDDVNLAGVNRACSFFSSARGDLTGALRLAEVASAAAERGSADAKQRAPLGDVSAALFALDRLDEALEVLDQALSAAEHYSRGMVSGLEIIRAHFLLAAGRLDEALVEADSAATDAEDSRRTPAPPVALLELQAEVAVQRGDMATARAAAEEIASLLEAGRADLPCYWPMALVADADGRPGDALKMMSKTLDALAAGRYFLGVPHYDSLPRLASIALRAGERAAAETVTRAAGTLADLNPGVPGIAGAAAHCVGLLERSEPDLRRAVATLAAGPRPLAAAAAMEDLAALLETTGDRPAVIDLRQSAYQIYDRTGAARDADRVRGELRRLGVLRPPTVEKARHGWESLSPAELAVVQVVAEGVTSQVAAERLYLSVNTVNTHLRHAFAKLGVRSRAGLTRIVLAHQPTTS